VPLAQYEPLNERRAATSEHGHDEFGSPPARVICGDRYRTATASRARCSGRATGTADSSGNDAGRVVWSGHRDARFAKCLQMPGDGFSHESLDFLARVAHDGNAREVGMRIAPAGLLGLQYSGDRFELGCDVAALTHGHPSGYLAAGALAEIVAQILNGRPLAAALDEAERRLLDRPRHEETFEALRAARALAAAGAEPGPDAIATLGAGWVAEEALAISVYCALVAESFEDGVRLAVNHSGDSDSTGAITGNLLGLIIGAGAIPTSWVEHLELRDEIEQLVSD
jgi:hypothetical protein